MCQECHQVFCPAACPNSEPDNSPRCLFCGEVLQENNYYTDSCSNLYCPQCINECDIEDILWICECRSVGALLMRYGALKKHGSSSEDRFGSSEKNVEQMFFMAKGSGKNG